MGYWHYVEHGDSPYPLLIDTNDNKNAHCERSEGLNEVSLGSCIGDVGNSGVIETNAQALDDVRGEVQNDHVVYSEHNDVDEEESDESNKQNIENIKCLSNSGDKEFLHVRDKTRVVIKQGSNYCRRGKVVKL